MSRHACEIVAWTMGGSAYCPGCEPARGGRDEPSPVFGDSADDLVGWTCDACSACYVGGEWLAHDAAVSDAVRWTLCGHCGSQRPHTGGDYRGVRRDAWRGVHPCPCCGQRGTTRFPAPRRSSR